MMRFMKIVALMTGLLVAVWAQAKQPAFLGSMTPAGTPVAGSQEVAVGFYPVTVYNLSLANNTYYLSGYLWLRWKGDIDPTENLEFLNGVQEWDVLKHKLNAEPLILKDGSKYQILRIDGAFFQTFSLADFPLDHQQLELQLEDSNNGVDKLHYVVDTRDSGLSGGLSVPGWNVEGWDSTLQVHDYGSQFGGDGDDVSASAYSALTFSIHIARPVSFLVWKLLLPLAIVLGAAWVALLLEPGLIEVRTGMPATSLLTTVFLQQSYSANLPEVGYLVMLDKIYVVAYVLIVLTLIRVILVGRVSDEAEGHAVVRRRDRAFLFVQAAFFVVATAAIILLR